MTARAIISNGDTGLSVRTKLNLIQAREFPAREFGATANGVTDDYQAIQDAIDAAHAAGGGIVTLPSGIMNVESILEIKTGVILRGCGAYSTIIQNPAGALSAKTIGGVSINASLALVAVNDAGVENLTLDHRTNVTTSTNGIQIGENGASSRSYNCHVSNCRLLGNDGHKYLIYAKLADDLIITGNHVYGVVSGYATADLVGIELFGSARSRVFNNRVERCYYGVIAKNEAAIANTYVTECIVDSNTIDNCVIGIEFSATSGTNNIVKNCIISKNIVTNSSARSILLGAGASAEMSDTQIVGNVLRESANNALLTVDSDAAANTSGLVLSDNTIIQTGGSDSGIYVIDANNVSIVRNTVMGSPYNGCVINNSTVNILNNIFNGSQRDMIRFIGTSDDCLVMGNAITDYGQSGAYRGVWCDTNTNNIAVIDNFFKYGAGASSAYAVDLYAGTNGVVSGVRTNHVTQNPVYRNGTGGRNCYNSAGYDRNTNRVSAIFPREIGINQANDAILTAACDVDGVTPLRMRTNSTPASAGATGNKGEVKWDTDYIYVCTATNTWKRAALTTW